MKFEEKYEKVEEKVLDHIIDQDPSSEQFEKDLKNLASINAIKEKVKQNEFVRDSKECELNLEAERNRLKQDEINLKADDIEAGRERVKAQNRTETLANGLKLAGTVFSGVVLLAGIGYCCIMEPTTIPSRNGLSMVKDIAKVLTTSR